VKGPSRDRSRTPQELAERAPAENNAPDLSTAPPSRTEVKPTLFAVRDVSGQAQGRGDSGGGGQVTNARGAFVAPPDWTRVEGRGFVIHVDPLQESPLAFALSVAAGLDSRPRRLDARFLYDAVGSQLFERITEQPEYYLTRAETRLLAAGARDIRAAAGGGALVELGSGASTKTRNLLDAWCAAGPATYVPVDVDAHALAKACLALRCRYPSLAVEGLGASYERALPALTGASPMTLAFLGSSLGNLGWHEHTEFCTTIAATLAPGDHFLIGVDLVKSPAALEAAYDDAAGITAAFTRNLFARMNRELSANIPLDAVRHVAFYDSDHERIEIFAEATREWNVRLPALGRELRVARGERILTEVSYKFRPEAISALIERLGFRGVWRAIGQGVDGDDDGFGLFLFRRTNTPAPACGRPPSAPITPHALLAETRARTMEIVAGLTDDDLRRQHSRLMSPIAWDLGHIAHFEALWLLREGSPAAGSRRDGDREGSVEEDAVEPLYDPLATPRARRDQLPLPAVEEVRRHMRAVRQLVEQRLDAPGGLTPDGRDPRLPPWLVTLVSQHEAQHQETILQSLALRDDLRYRPGFVSERPPQAGARPTSESLLVPAGAFIMGTNDREWAYDNERPAHEVELPAFRIDRTPVTNRGYLAFMREGGYTRRELWSASGWRWRAETGAHAPRHWRPAPRPDGVWRGLEGATEIRADAWHAVVFGKTTPLQPDSPVVHVSWYEADAYARWAGGRLPTEPEWEKAAAWDPARGASRRYPWGDEPWDPARANLDQRHLEPAPAGAFAAGRSAYGCEQMLGDVWEWTATWFDGYPGYQSFPYKEYSEIFFGQTYRVLRGGSFATRASVARATLRNWDLPERRQIFAGFRCVRDA